LGQLRNSGRCQQRCRLLWKSFLLSSCRNTYNSMHGVAGGTDLVVKHRVDRLGATVSPKVVKNQAR
jgi:hypothetical protein